MIQSDDGRQYKQDGVGGEEGCPCETMFGAGEAEVREVFLAGPMSGHMAKEVENNGIKSEEEPLNHLKMSDSQSLVTSSHYSPVTGHRSPSVKRKFMF